MFLAIALIRRQHSSYIPWHLITTFVLFLLSAAASNAQEPAAPCVLEVPVYSPSGDLLPFRVTRVTPWKDKGRNLLSIGRVFKTTTANGYRIIFSSDRIVSREIEVTLEDPKGVTVKTHFVVPSCRLRISLFLGQSDTGTDITGIGMTGQLKGCKFEGDWWVRAVPMFGGHDRVFAVDGYVHSDGNFWLVFAYTVRHVLIIGKGKEPIKTIALDVLSDKRINLGVIDLTGSCPKQ